MNLKTPKIERETLDSKIKSRTLRAGIIGLGYVGLPLAVEFARSGIQVVGFDIDEAKVKDIAEGKSHAADVDGHELSALVLTRKLQATTDFDFIENLDTVNICVPTPLGKSRDPDISFIIAAANEVGKRLHREMLVILESTTYPGTTEEVVLPMLEETGLKAGKDFYLAFSPERIDPGNLRFNTRNIPKIVGGLTTKCAELAKAFYEIAIERVLTVSSPRSAEMVKLLENTFRSVNIGLVNEICLMSEKLGLDIWEIIDAAATKPFGFMPFYPGPGLGGHCIPVDPHYLAWKARLKGFNPRFIELASTVNEQMPEFVVRKAQDYLNGRSKPLKGSKILILGVTYKKNVSDIRESPAFNVIELLEKAGAEVSFADPHCGALTVNGKTYRSVELQEAGARFEFRHSDLTKYDLAILITDHDAFNYDAILAHVPAFLDTRNAAKHVVNGREKIIRI